MLFKNHPRGLVQAALANMGERFGYYIMNAVLVLFLCSKFGISEKMSTIIYSVFYFGIYFLSLVGGIIADRKQNYNGTIAWGLVVMSLGYVILAIPILSTADNINWLLPLTCFALFMIAFGNGLFKGNLQAIVGQMYDNFERDRIAAGEDPKVVRSRRDSGFQIFYVFINIGGLIAPFVAPLLRSWWLGVHNWAYNADLPALCHQYLEQGANMAAGSMANLTDLVSKVGGTVGGDLTAFCTDYLNVFNTGVHYSFIGSVVAMLISLTIFLASRKIFPTPDKKVKAEVVGYTPEEKTAMAKEIKQRLYALFAVLGIAIFFWFSFHQNGQSLSLFARDFVVTSQVAPEIWQALNPFFVVVLTPLITIFFGYFIKRGKEISTPRKIAIGMAIAGCAYLFLALFSIVEGYPSAVDFRDLPVSVREPWKVGPWILVVTYFFLTVAELFISPLGLSFVSKVAPKHLQGLCQGLWLTATAIGNLFLWLGPLIYENFPIWQCWTVFFAVCFISMAVMLGMVKWLERVTK